MDLLSRRGLGPVGNPETFILVSSFSVFVPLGISSLHLPSSFEVILYFGGLARLVVRELRVPSGSSVDIEKSKFNKVVE